MLIQNDGKPRILRINRQDCKTPEALALWAGLYKVQKKEDLAKRGERIKFGAKRRDAIAPRWVLDPFLRVLLSKGRTEVAVEFADAVIAALAGEIAVGRMSISGAPEVAEEDLLDVAPQVAPQVKPPKAPPKKKVLAKDAECKSKKD